MYVCMYCVVYFMLPGALVHTFVVGELARVCVDDFSSSLFFVVLQNEKGVRSVDFFFCVFFAFFRSKEAGSVGITCCAQFSF